MADSPVLPLRPLTVGELLDAGAALLRSRWRVLLTMAGALALGEQLVMTTVRVLTVDDVRPQYTGDLLGDNLILWLWFLLGLFIETMILSVLSGPATRTAVAVIRGEDERSLGFWTLTATTWAPVIGIASLLGGLGLVAAAMCFIPWYLVLALFALAVPALVADGVSPSRALARSMRLLGRSHGRVGWVLVLAHLSWTLLRGAVTFGALYALESGSIDFVTLSLEGFMLLLGVFYVVLNTAAHALMSCLIAALHIETRVRTEGLDVEVALMRSRGRPLTLTAPEAR